MPLDAKYLRTVEFPTIWCSGCGHGIITQAAIRACNEMGWEKDDVYAVSGIGCSARTPAYMDFNSIQTTHGRAIVFATGMKAFRPEKHVFLMLGDGDCASIGGNHFLHACKRNIDLTVVVLNNYIYGMTGGQVSPTTPQGGRSTTTVYGNIDEPLDICKLAIAAGATYVARSTAYHAAQIPALIKKGFENKGMSVIEVISPCPTGFGVRNGYSSITQMYDELRDKSVPVANAEKMTNEELAGKIVVGVLRNEVREEYVERYYNMLKSIPQEGGLTDLTAGSYEADLMDSPRYECRLSGSGGQGLVVAGIILSEAMIRQGKHVVHTQSYGVEARGGASRSEVVISDQGINYPKVTEPDMLLAMTQDSYNKFAQSVKKGGIILIDSTFVKSKPIDGIRWFEYPITTYAKETIGEARTANVVGLGLLTGLNGFISKQAMLDAIMARLPQKLHTLNVRAFEDGYAQGKAMLEVTSG